MAVAATALLTGSQATLLIRGAGEDAAERGDPFAILDEPLPRVASQGDDAYHTELPPLEASEIPDPPGAPTPPPPAPKARGESGIPATVLAAYRRAEKSVGRTDPGCRLPWQLLAAIGKVESGQARGGAVDARGTTLSRITGPPLNGDGFALIHDTDDGEWDGDTAYDRAVGPMQFLPGTWHRWGADGNGDGRADPNNIFDAALAAGRYLCAGDRDLGKARDLNSAILSYNYSRDYVRLVLHWLEFYRGGVHTVPDGTGVVPVSPGAGSKTQATKPVGGDKGDGGIIIGPDPTKPPERPGPSESGDPTGSPDPSPGPTDGETPPTDPAPTDPDPTDPGPTEPDPTDSASPAPDPTDSGSPDPDPTDPDPTDPDPTDPEPTDPDPTPTDSGSPEPDPSDPATTDPEPTATATTDPDPTDDVTEPPAPSTSPSPSDSTSP